MVTMRLSGTVIEIFSLEDIGVTTLTFWGHVTSSVTCLSGKVIEIQRVEYIAVTTLTVGVT